MKCVRSPCNGETAQVAKRLFVAMFIQWVLVKLKTEGCVSKFTQMMGIQLNIRPIYLIVSVALAVLVVGGGLNLLYRSSLRQSHDFGARLGEAKLEHVFVVPNFSGSKIRIDKVQTSCGCTVVKESSEITSHFGSVRVPVSMDIAQKHGITTAEVVVELSNSDVAVFQLKATVYPALPQKVLLGNVKRGETIRRAYLLDDSFSSLSLCKKSTSRSISMTTMEIKGQPVVEIIVDSNALPNGEFSSSIVFDCPQGSLPSVTVEGNLESQVKAESPLVSVGYLSSDSLGQKNDSHTIKFHSPYGNSFRWNKEETKSSDLISLESSAQIDSEVSFMLSSELPSGLFSETVDFVFHVEGSDLVTVPVTIYAYITQSGTSETGE